jgi:Galactose oxidase, central domain
MDSGWWSTPLAPYPISVAESQGAMIGKDFVIFSGFKNGYSMATTETYALDMSVSNASWRRMDDMPFPLGLTHLGIAVVGMKAYLCGGYVGGSLGLNAANCFIYDHSAQPGFGQQWSSFASLPDGGRSGGGMIYDSKINAIVYAAGSKRLVQGVSGSIDFVDTWMFSIKNPSAGWVTKTNIPFTGNHMNFVTALDCNGIERHFFFGGQMGDNEATGNTATMYEYVATTDKWIKRASMPFPRGHSAAASRAIGGGFIVAGGRTNTGLTSDITYYDIANDAWSLIGNLPVEIHTNVCVIANGLLRCETGWATGSFSAQRPIMLG